MNIREILVRILEYTDDITIYCYYQTSKSNKKILYELIRTSMINIIPKHSIHENLCIMAADSDYLEIFGCCNG